MFDNGRAAQAALLLKTRLTLVDRVFQGLVVVALIAAPVSVSRSFTTGWMPVYTLHIVVGLVILGVYFFRRAIPFPLKSALLIVILWSIGIAGLLSFGILGAGYWWLVLSSLLVSTLYSVRAGIITAVATTVLMAAIGLAFITGTFTVTVDLASYGSSVASWTGLLVAAIITPLVVFHAIAGYQQTMLELLKEVHEQRDRIQQLATHDQLTGLPLMDLATDRLQVLLHAARRSNTKVALLFIDLDGFKDVNDTLGHAAGDHVLKEVAHRLLKAMRAEDTAARAGGDEFIVIAGGLPDGRVPAQIASRAIRIVSAPIDYEGRQTTVGISIGIGLFPDHADDAQSLRRAADAAMYRVKRSGKNQFAFADQDGWAAEAGDAPPPRRPPSLP
jgi:diguanylate cyclase (GGDEF)-like protein